MWGVAGGDEPDGTLPPPCPLPPARTRGLGSTVGSLLSICKLYLEKLMRLAQSVKCGIQHLYLFIPLLQEPIRMIIERLLEVESCDSKVNGREVPAIGKMATH